MKSIVVGALLALLTSPANAMPTAGELATACSKVRDADHEVATIALGLCAPLLQGFIDGYRVGANAGLRVAFIDDELNLYTGQGMADTWRRISAVRPKAECMPANVTAEQVANALGKYLLVHPEKRGESYIEPLTNAVLAAFCPTDG